MLTETNTGRYRVGQIWKFHARPGEENAAMTIVRVDSSASQAIIVHVSVGGLRIKNLRAPSGFTDTISHAPFTEDAIARSVTTLVGETKTLPDFEEGYQEWRSANGGVFSVTVAEAISFMERAVNQ